MRFKRQLVTAWPQTRATNFPPADCCSLRQIIVVGGRSLSAFASAPPAPKL